LYVQKAVYLVHNFQQVQIDCPGRAKDRSWQQWLYLAWHASCGTLQQQQPLKLRYKTGASEGLDPACLLHWQTSLHHKATCQQVLNKLCLWQTLQYFVQYDVVSIFQTCVVWGKHKTCQALPAALHSATAKVSVCLSMVSCAMTSYLVASKACPNSKSVNVSFARSWTVLMCADQSKGLQGCWMLLRCWQWQASDVTPLSHFSIWTEQLKANQGKIIWDVLFATNIQLLK